jgi:1,4-alpha-glucan branching enzyme
MRKQFSVEGFEWINYEDTQNSVLAYIRKGNNEKENIIIVCNMTPVVHSNYRIGLSQKMLTVSNLSVQFGKRICLTK